MTSLLRAAASSSSTLKGREPVHRYYTRGKIYDTFFKATIGGIMVFSVGVCSFVLFDVVRMITRKRLFIIGPLIYNVVVLFGIMTTPSKTNYPK